MTSEARLVDRKNLPSISVVVITYNRIQTLRETVNFFLQNVDYPIEKIELVISDDGSDTNVLEQIRTLPFQKLVEAHKRKGLSANANRGLNAASHEIILQIQDDWKLGSSGANLTQLVQILLDNPEIGLILLNQHPNKNLPYATRTISGHDLRIFHNQPEKRLSKVGDHAYSDWPHIKTRQFVNRIGPYDEALQMWDAELDYSRRINNQKDFAVADIVGLVAFEHIGEEYSYNTGPLHARIKKILLQFRFFRKLRVIKSRALRGSSTH